LLREGLRRTGAEVFESTTLWTAIEDKSQVRGARTLA
jgi:hypothetical protein